MNIGTRIKRVRELRGYNLKAISAKMGISPQTYSNIEAGVNLKYSTVRRFCEAVDIDPSFCLAEDVPVSAETIEFFDRMKDKSFLLCHEQLRQKVEVYGEVLNLNPNT